MEVGSDGGGSMDTIVQEGQFYPELDAIYSSKSVVNDMYQGNVYQWMYQMTNPSTAYQTWNTDADRFARVAGVVSGPGWLSGARVAKQPGTGPGGTWTLYFNVRPTQTGTSNEEYQMVRELVSWFGDKVASNGNMRTTVTVSRKLPSPTDGWDNGAKRKGETVRFSVYGSDSWGTGDNYSWDFDGSTTQGWSVANNCNITPEAANGRLKIGITGGDPHIVSSGGLAIDCSKANYVSIRMMASGGSTAQFFWSGTAGGWHEVRHVDFNIYPDNRWHVYTIKLPASWTGTVHQFRFDPVQTGAANGQTVYVDWIRIHNVNAGMSAKAYLGKTDHTWSIWNAQDATWDATNVCWYKDYTIPDGYPQTYYHLMYVHNNANQGFGNDPDQRYGLYQRAYKVLNTAPTAANNSYPSNGWCTTKTPSLGWNYSDVDSNAQSRYQVQVSTAANFSNIVADTNLVASNSNSGTTSSLPEGQLYYRTRVMDGAYNNLNATYQGGVSLNQAGALSGDSGSKSVDFNGTNGYVSLPSGYDSFGGGFTCEFWAYPTAVQTWARFVDMGNGPNADNIVIAREAATNNIRFYLYRGSTSAGILVGANAISLNTWQHFVATIDTSGWGRIYKNGSLIAQGPMSVPEAITRSNVYIGKSNWEADTYYKGRMDEFAIYDRCLSASEISDHYAKASQSGYAYRDAVCASGPWTYYRFDETSGTTASAYTGMLSNWSTATGFRVDSIAPTKPGITSINISNCTTASISFGGSTDTNDLTYEVKLDNGNFETKTSPAVYSSLSNGPHTVYVRAIDEAGNISEVASQQFDNSLPNTPTNPLANPATIVVSGSSALSATVGSGEEVVWYKDSCGGTVVTSPVSPTETTTYYARARNTTTGCMSASCAQVTVTYVADDEGPELTNVSVTCSDVGDAPNYNFLKGTVTVEAEASDSSGVASVIFYIDDSETPITMTYDPNTGKYVGTCTIDEDWTNGQHSITVVAADTYGNESDDTKNFPVNKNEIEGLVGLEESFVQCTRPVTFVLNGTVNKTLTLNFISGKAYYNFVDIPEITTISAKTAWHLRSRRDVTMTKGQAEIDFLGSKVLRGGDLVTPGKPMGDNVVNALDYAVLRTAWGTGVAGDINGDGYTDNNDYLIMLRNLYLKGDQP
ncbi:MAG: LamG-like jellyroll fold domain-containing protein [Armatimonadota bacterium]